MSDASGTDGSDAMRERVDESRLKLWVLLETDRRVLAGLLVTGVFVTLVVLGTVDPSPLRGAMASADPVETTFQAFLTGTLTVVTLVVTLNQLVISQELGAVGDQRERMNDALDYRQDVAEAMGVSAASPEPSVFLRSLLETTGTCAGDLREAVVGDATALRADVDALATDVETDAADVRKRLEGAQFGTFDVLFAALDFNYSLKLYDARRLRNAHADTLAEDAREAFDRLIEVLAFFGPAREHFKTLYFQWELVDLSRLILYAGIPAIMVSAGMILFVDDPATIRGSTIGVDNLVLLVSAAVAVATVPFMLLVVYVLRIATVAKRTLAIGPFVLRSIDGDDSE